MGIYRKDRKERKVFEQEETGNRWETVAELSASSLAKASSFAKATEDGTADRDGRIRLHQSYGATRMDEDGERNGVLRFRLVSSTKPVAHRVKTNQTVGDRFCSKRLSCNNQG